MLTKKLTSIEGEAVLWLVRWTGDWASSFMSGQGNFVPIFSQVYNRVPAKLAGFFFGGEGAEGGPYDELFSSW